MSYEIVYTSSPRGLKEGDRGFCTVAATTGIPRSLREKLETLSGYRHAFTPSSAENPVNYSYLIVKIQNEKYHILSRIADAGVDFSGRTNKIAHHLALPADELRDLDSSPISLLADASFWCKAWEKKPQPLPAGRLPSSQHTSTGICKTWNQMFGDAGWAGLLARAARLGHNPVWVIIPSGTKNLALLNEAMQLVSPDDRWRICFSTYYSRVPAGAECHWRFVLDGSDEADALRARPTGVVVDPLQSRSELPDDDPFVEAARSGDVTAIHSAPSRRRSSASRGSREVATTASQRPVTRSQLRRREAGARARQARLAARSRPEPELEYIEDLAPEPLEHVASSRGKNFWLLLVLSVVVVVAVVLSYVWFS